VVTDRARIEPLLNPERNWEHPDAQSIDRAEVEQRLGREVERFEVLSGGLANDNVRVDGDHVLRIYRRRPESMRKEAALLRRGWRSFRVPEIIAAGDDFLLLEHVAHGPIEGSTIHGAAVGRALAEIHATTYASAGLLGPDAALTDPFDDFVSAHRDQTAREATTAAGVLPTELAGRALDHLDRHAGELRGVAGPAVLLHGDFKVSNLHWTSRDELLVLDWEFAWAGSALMDIGQLARWSLPPAFEGAFVVAYRAAGGQLPEDWKRWAAAFDLVNLVGLLQRAPPGSRRAHDVVALIAATLR
jgi:hypothetical protein